MYRFDPGSTQVSLVLKLRDSTTGLAKKTLTAASAGGVAGYSRQRGNAVAIPLVALSGPTAAWQAGGFVELDATLQPGAYRLDIPDATCAAGVPFAVASLAFTGVIEESVLIRLDKAVSNVGPGSIPATVCITNTATGLPLAGARVWVTTDAGGTNVVAGTLTTDSFGAATFYLNAGTYYVWVSDPGYTSANPTTLVVS